VSRLNDCKYVLVESRVLMSIEIWVAWFAYLYTSLRPRFSIRESSAIIDL